MRSANRALLLGLLLGATQLSAQVPYRRLLRASTEPGEWLTYSGDYSARRYSPLADITPANVASLRPAWIYQSLEPGTIQASPLVADGIMYLTEPRGHLAAIDVHTGRLLWRYAVTLPKNLLTLGFGPTNRGVALLDSTVFVGTLDARLIALDARSGALRWKTQVGDNAAGFSITGAPLALNGLVVVGVSGGEAGIRGFLDAYDAKTGERRWRFYTIPAPGEPGAETWSGDAWKTGGGATWLTGSYDPELDLIYWGVGNPGPDWNGDNRPGDNLYTCSLVALDASTGTLRWHFQFTPHDTHDWDATEIPVLIDGAVAGRPRKLVAFANRNAFFYLLDRVTGEFLLGTPYAHQTWADGLDPLGRPRFRNGTEPTEAGTLLTPSLQGATNWFSPAFSPRTRLFYVAAREMTSRYFKSEASYQPGTYFMGGGESAITGDSATGAIRALDPLSGRVRWEFPLLSAPWGGVLATAGGLVFGGSNEGDFFALDAQTGKPLWSFQTGGAINANPIAFAVDGKEHVAIGVGPSLIVFSLPSGAR
jgi:alcohol dehydrogenase (cytochrome c)